MTHQDPGIFMKTNLYPSFHPFSHASDQVGLFIERPWCKAGSLKVKSQDVTLSKSSNTQTKFQKKKRKATNGWCHHSCYILKNRPEIKQQLKSRTGRNKVRRLPESMFDQSKVSLLFKRYNSLRKQSWNIAWDRFSMESWKKNTPSNMLFSWSMIYMQNQKSHTQTPYSKNCCTRTKPWQNNSSTIFGPPKKNDCNKTPVLYFFSKHPGAKEKLFRWGKLLCLHLPFSDLFRHHGDGIRLAGARSTWILIGILVEEIWGDGEISMRSPCFVGPGAAFCFNQPLWFAKFNLYYYRGKLFVWNLQLCDPWVGGVSPTYNQDWWELSTN